LTLNSLIDTPVVSVVGRDPIPVPRARIARVPVTSNPLVGRPHGTQRFRNVTVGVLLGAVGAGVLVRGNLLGVGLVVLALLLLADLWRKVTVTADRVVAQGRVSRRTADLSELTQVALSAMNRPWVAPRHGRSFYLRMVTEHPDEFVTELRARATAAGASLEPAPVRTSPPGAAPLFSA
jgi:hypothetical protein